MCSCGCGGSHKHDELVPMVGVITDIKDQTPDVKTFRVERPEGGKLFEHMPGQCAMISVPGVGEAMFSITSSPTNKEYQEFSIKRCGTLTDYLHTMEVGDELTVRGPYGNAFPVETVLKGQNLLFVAGGIGLAPLCFRRLRPMWKCVVNVYLTIDREQPEWDGHVGFVPSYLKELEFSVDKTVLVCGPPIMIKFVLAALQEMGFEKTQVYTTLELRMKCGIGKCGRCNIGSKYVCKDGPVFRCDEVDELPDEY